MNEDEKKTKFLLFTQDECEFCEMAVEKYKDEIEEGSVVTVALVRGTDTYDKWVDDGIIAFPTMLKLSTGETKEASTKVCVVDVNDVNNEIACNTTRTPIDKIFVSEDNEDQSE